VNGTEARKSRAAWDFKLRHYRGMFLLDARVGISAFVKLKLTKCAPISGLPEIGFFVRKSGNPDLRPGDRAGLFVGQEGSVGIPPLGSYRAIRPPALRAPHGSGALPMAVHCFRIVFSIGQCSGAMHFCLVVAWQKDRAPHEARCRPSRIPPSRIRALHNTGACYFSCN
jgi:hypothetical protein